jgi:hypothetical protein
MHTRIIGALVVCLALGATAGLASADPGPATDRMRLSVGAELGFGGEIDTEVEGGGQTLRGESDLTSTYGFRLHFEYPLHDYFGLGLLTAFRWGNAEVLDDQNIDSTLLISINLAPRVRYPLMNGRLEIYMLLPIGLDISVPPDDLEPQGGDVSGGAAFSLGFFPGVQYLFTDSFGAYFELGFRTMNIAYERSQGNLSEDTTTSGLQFHMSFGGVFTF